MNDAVGSMAEEAAKLFAAVQERLGDLHQGPECQVCPVCQLLAAVRTARPEVFEHLAEASAALLLALRAVVDAQPRRDGPPIERITVT